MSKPKTTKTAKKKTAKKPTSKTKAVSKTAITKPAATGKALVRLRKENVVQWRAIVRLALEQTGSRRVAAGVLKVSHPTVSNWTKRDAAIAKGIKLRGRGRPRKIASDTKSK